MTTEERFRRHEQLVQLPAAEILDDTVQRQQKVQVRHGFKQGVEKFDLQILGWNAWKCHCCGPPGVLVIPGVRMLSPSDGVKGAPHYSPVGRFFPYVVRFMCAGACAVVERCTVVRLTRRGLFCDLFHCLC